MPTTRLASQSSKHRWLKLKPSMQRAWRKRVGQRGVTALEFALVAPMVLLVIFFTIEVGIMMMADATLGRVANQIYREGQISRQTATANWDPADCTGSIKKLLKSGMGGWIPKSEDLFVEIVATYNLDKAFMPVNPANYWPTCKSFNENGMAVYRIGFTRPGFSGILNWLGINLLRFERRILLQNEP